MKTITVRLPEAMAAEIESESEAAGISKSDVVRRRLEGGGSPRSMALFDLATDLIGSVDDSGVPRDLSSVRMFLNYFGVEIVFGVKDHFGTSSDDAVREISHILRHGMIRSGFSGPTESDLRQRCELHPSPLRC